MVLDYLKWKEKEKATANPDGATNVNQSIGSQHRKPHHRKAPVADFAYPQR